MLHWPTDTARVMERACEGHMTALRRTGGPLRRARDCPEAQLCSHQLPALLKLEEFHEFRCNTGLYLLGHNPPLPLGKHSPQLAWQVWCTTLQHETRENIFDHIKMSHSFNWKSK